MAYPPSHRSVQYRTCAYPISPRLFTRTNTTDCGATGRLATTMAPSACRFTPRARIQPDFLEIFASKCIFNLWLRRRSGCPDGPLHRQCFRRLKALNAGSFVEAVVCTIDSIMGGAADEGKYGGFHFVT